MTNGEFRFQSKIQNLNSKMVWPKFRFVEGGDHAPRRNKFINFGPVFSREGDLEGGQIVFQLGHSARANDGAGDAGLLDAPGQCQLSQCATLLIGHRLQAIDYVIEISFEAGAERRECGHPESESAVLRQRLISTIFAGEQTTRQRTPGNGSEPIGLGHG